MSDSYQIKCADALTYLANDTHLTALINFSLFGKIYGKTLGAGMSVFYRNLGLERQKDDVISIDKMNEMENVFNSINQKKEAMDKAGHEAEVDREVLFRRWVYAMQRMEERFNPIQPMGATAKWMLSNSLEELEKSRPIEIEKIEETLKVARLPEKDQERIRKAEIAKLDRDIGERKETVYRALMAAGEMIANAGKIDDIQEEYTYTMTEDDKECRMFPEDVTVTTTTGEESLKPGFLTVLVEAIEGAKKGVLARQRGRSLADITADLALLNAFEDTL